mmetsp:Transcript_6386/g.19310  ORF Transcript_6386/g.19310 Transcript_6386/m.19310 type:complete len:263 (-) Transcript_6386:1999-2787(-)
MPRASPAFLLETSPVDPSASFNRLIFSPASNSSALLYFPAVGRSTGSTRRMTSIAGLAFPALDGMGLRSQFETMRGLTLHRLVINFCVIQDTCFMRSSVLSLTASGSSSWSFEAVTSESLLVIELIAEFVLCGVDAFFRPLPVEYGAVCVPATPVLVGEPLCAVPAALSVRSDAANFVCAASFEPPDSRLAICLRISSKMSIAAVVFSVDWCPAFGALCLSADKSPDGCGPEDCRSNSSRRLSLKYCAPPSIFCCSILVAAF